MRAARCARCGLPVFADQLWELDHSEERSGISGFLIVRAIGGRR